MKSNNHYDAAADFWKQTRRTADEKISPYFSKLNRPHVYIEKPAMKKKLPNLKGKRVLALGCGSGEEIEFILEKGATDIIGIDISENLIKLAQEKYPKLKFFAMDAEKLLFKDSSFDYVYSSLVLDHLKNWDKVLAEVMRVLSDKGIFLFSTTHPVKWSADHVVDSDGKNVKAIMGYDQTVSPVKIFGNYLSITRRDEVWGGKIAVTTYSRPISDSFRALRNSGFLVIDIVEPKSTVAAKKNNRDYFDIYQRIPNFVIFECIKP